MDSSTANCPLWLANRLKEAGGAISFYNYMDLVLNDLDHGAYSSGQINIGKGGDFVTSPSLSSDFAELLAVQLVEWFEQLSERRLPNLPLTLVEIGPGEGKLIEDLIIAFENISPGLCSRIEIILVEPNLGMKKRQIEYLSRFSEFSIHWRSLEQLANDPVFGVVIAHEVLDAFPVERLVLRDENLFRQGVFLTDHSNQFTLDYCCLPMTSSLEKSVAQVCKSINLKIPPDNAINGWTTEWHVEISPWLQKVSQALMKGPLLIIDYALEASRFYSSSRHEGTLMSYQNQIASSNLLLEKDFLDLTSHLCIDTLNYYASCNGWNLLGEVRQGQALLALGLAGRLNSLQELPNHRLGEALNRREALLRLVDPAGLGEFRWVAFYKSDLEKIQQEEQCLFSRFLEEPIH